MASNLSLEKAAQAWCTPSTSHLVLDRDLANAFAEVLDTVWDKAWLGNATTAELLEELKVRAEVGGYSNYKTTGDHECCPCVIGVLVEAEDFPRDITRD